ncbi:MAG: ABC transporter ATP-binding protein [Candidatus Aminicenantes bacterium]|nr:MAG: ABC transporter ATP-binding protein [Candidatus Aminicenantes bacterium]
MKGNIIPADRINNLFAHVASLQSFPGTKIVQGREETAVAVQELTRKFGQFTAVDGINFTIKRGEIIGFLGPNGAGKTTTIKMLTGLLRPTAGEISILGYDLRRELRQIKKHIGYMSQKFSLYPLLTAEENVEFFAGISGLSTSAIKHKKQELSRLLTPSLLPLKVADLPPGIKQKVALFTCLLTDPEIIFLDEPTSGVDPEMRRNFWSLIYELKTKGKTLLVSTHNLDEAEYADRLLIIHQGKIILDGPLAQLLQQKGASTIEELFKQAIINHETS